jgi:hypothetical protein
MSLPPDDEGQGGLSGITEPPIDHINDTKPLKPLDRGVAAQSGEQAQRLPPGTVLTEAGKEHTSLPKGLESFVKRDDETNRVRLIPRLPNPPTWRVIFQVGNPPSTTIGVDVRQALIIGRSDAEDDDLPGIDLGPHLGVEHGVSRQHAVLLPTGDSLQLSDLGSTNGTWINGAYLEPGQRYPLSSGDKVEVGLLRLIVRSVTLMSRSSG